MSKKYPGGLITKTPITPTGPYQDGSASGVWSMEQMQYWMKQGLWPIAGNLNPGDPYFKYVTLLIPGNGTNNSKNTTYLDSSPNNFTITDTDAYSSNAQGSMNPYGSNWSTYLYNPSGLRYATPSSYYFGTNDFTVECWVNFSTLDGTGGHSFIGDWSNSTGQSVWGVFFNDQSNLLKFIYGNNTTKDFSWTPTKGVWYHIAMCRSSGTLRCFINGTQIGSDTSFTNNINSTYSTGYFYIGMANSNASYLNGYISNVRVNNTALYTSNFTPSAAPLTAVSGTIGLMCQSNRFVDNSSTNSTITAYSGTPQITSLSPFEPNNAYSPATLGGSTYFGGSGQLTTTSSSNLAIGSGDFTCEFWVYPFSYSSVFYSASYTDNLQIQVDSAGETRIWCNGNWIRTGYYGIQLYAWTHIAAVRSSGTVTLYINGVNSVSGTITGGTTSSKAASLGYAEMYLSDVRFVKGTAVYTSNFTPPTVPLTSITNTQLLCNFTNAGIYDASQKADLQSRQNVNISTSQSKFGGSSVYFNLGAGGGNLVSNNQGLVNGIYTNDFTIEMWVYKTSTGSEQYLIDYRAGSDTSLAPSIYINSSEQLIFQTQATTRITGGTISANTWTFVTVCRSSGTTKMYINGTQTGSSYTDSNNYVGSLSRPTIGSAHTPNRYLGGYLQDVRVTTGYARYTANFTAPTTAFYTF